MKKILFLLAFPLIFTFCKKEITNNPTGVEMTYQMTQCADPWQDDANYFKDKEGTLKTYLAKQGVTVLKLSIVEDCVLQSAACTACMCAGCDRATVSVNGIDIAVMKKLMFVVK